MAVTRNCSVRERRAVLDVAAGEYLKYELTFRGAQAAFVVRDDLQNVLTIEDQVSPGLFAIEWHPSGGWDGADTHNFRASMFLAESYSLVIRQCRSDGGTKAIIRNCKYTRTSDREVAVDMLRVYSGGSGQ
jgi:hypothetical protein